MQVHFDQPKTCRLSSCKGFIWITDHIFKKPGVMCKTSTVIESVKIVIKSHFRADGHIEGLYVYPIKPVCQRHYSDVVSYPVQFM